ncbi:MAG TPA: TonB-dependent receptor, partial [Sphingomonas sp.]|nr:TonB-dependent receptor [Sphingomonas sp.]
DARATFDRFQPKVSLSYRVTPAVQVYGSYGRGFRSGGFNQYAPTVPRAFAFNPAVVGSAMPYVPDFTMALSADWEKRVGADTRLTTHIAYRMTGPRSFTLDFPDVRSGTHRFVDLRIGLSHGPWALTAFGENIFNERMPEDLFGVFNGAVDLARQPNRPRRYGLELKRRFGATG